MKTQVNYTTINHVARERLQLSWLEYGLCDLIYNLSNNPKSPVPGWCFASRETLGKRLGLSRRAIFDMIDRLIDRKLIDRHPETKNLRITIDWYKIVIMKEDDTEVSGEATAPPVQNSTSEVVKQLHQTGEATAPDAGEATAPNIDSNIYINKTSTKVLEEKISSESDNDEISKLTKTYGKPEINQVINLLKGLYPEARITQGERYSVNRMLKKKPVERIVKALQFAYDNRDERFCPVIVSCYDLEKKWVKLEEFARRQNREATEVDRGVPFNKQAEEDPHSADVPPEHWERIRELEALEKLQNGQKT